MHDLPDEIHEYIFSYLFFKDIYKLSETNSFFYKIIRKYYTYILPKMYNYFCKTIKDNIVNNEYLLLNCNITYYYIDQKIKDCQSISFIDETTLENGIYYFSENVWRLTTIDNEYLLEYYKDLAYNKYLIIYKNNNKILVYCYKKPIYHNILEQELNFIDIKKYSKIFRIF
jgi:hypothetical protein